MARSYRQRSRSSRQLTKLRMTQLEHRIQPSTYYSPPTNFIVNQDAAQLDPRASQQSPLATALAYFREHAAAFGATAADLANPIVTNQYTDADTGTTHLYFQQQVNGLGVRNAVLNISVLANGNVLSAGGGFVADLESKVDSRGSSPIMSPLEAVRHAANGLNLPLTSEITYVDAVYGPVKSFALSAPSLSRHNISAEMKYVATADGSATLAWDLVIRTLDSQDWWSLGIDGTSGVIVAQNDWFANDNEYHVVPEPNEHPNDGGVMVITNPANLATSPFGWHDTNGVSGAESTSTTGNNVDAYLDRDADDNPDPTPPRPNGGAGLDFSGFVFDPGLEPSTAQNKDAAVVNLFYMNNLIHDVYYQYGFTEAAGNFQSNNYGKGGSGGDAVLAEAQDGSGLNNANFGTPPDGSNPAMQMFEWTNTTPRRDSDFDNGVIVHEYTHGLSNRLTGGPANSNALNATQSGGMGEGWGDYYAIMFSQRPADLQNGSYGIGTYLLGQPITGTGIRLFPYSYNMALNPLTWDAYGTSGTTSYGVTRSTQVHRTGTIWCSALWDMNWLLINKYGFDANLSTGWSATAGPANAGNKLAMRLVMEAMKLQPALPSFTQARDAIIAADIALNGGRDLYEIWSAFARRGLGALAATADANATTVTLDTTLPMVVSSVVPATGKVVTTSPTSYVVNVTSAIDAASLQAFDFKVNSTSATGVSYTPGATSVTFTFTVDPVAAEGLQSMSIAAGAFKRSSDGSNIAAFASNFYFDPTPLTVTSVSPATGSKVTLPFTTVDVNLNSAVNPASVAVGDLSISQGQVTGFALLNSDTTVRFTLGNVNDEGTLAIFVPAGAFTDANGSPNPAFDGGTVTLDHTTLPYPVTLTPRLPLGSLVYEGTTSATMGFGGDSDSFTLNLDAGQSLSVVVSPISTLRSSITVTGPGGTNQTFSASTNGAVAQLQSIPITTAGVYTLAVASVASTTGHYKLGVTVNVALESESNGGATNNSLATAQNLDSVFTSLGSGISRVAIRGASDLAASSEVEPNGTTATATVVTDASSLPTNLYQISISGANSSTTDSDYFNVGTLQAGDVVTFTNSGNGSGRGTQTDALARIYRNNGGSPILLISDDDSGPGLDGLIYKYTIPTTDTYIIRASRATSADVGSYQLSVLLENTGLPPTTGGTFLTEVEPNDTPTTPNNASTSWKQVKYDIGVNGSITAADTDIYSYQFTAGDSVTVIADSTSALIPQTALLNSGGTVLATEDGTSSVAGIGGFSPIYAYDISTTGTYYVRVTGGSGSTGSYSASVLRATTGSLSTAPQGKDLYSFTLATGQSASLALKNVTAGNLDVAILDGVGATVASGIAGSTNLDEFLASYTAPAAGTYYAQVTGVGSVSYDLVVVRGGTFDSEANDSFAAAQSMGGNTAAIGHNAAGASDWYQLTLATGNTLTVTTGTPGGDGGEFGNNFDPVVEIYDPSNVLVGSDDNSLDGRNASKTLVAAASGNYRVRVLGAGATAGEYLVKASVVTALPPKVSGLVVGDGTAQRSRVTKLTVSFDQVVTLPSEIEDAFTLTRQGGGTVLLDGSAVNSPNTTVTLTFVGGSVDFNSLADGKYDLTILQTMVSGPGGNLDGDGNGIGGDNYVQIGSVANGLFRFFGDIDGDGGTFGSDFNQFRVAFGGSNDAFDFDNDTAVAGSDFNQFKVRFGGSV